MPVLLEPQYFPSIPYFALLREHEQLTLEVHESWQKQSYRNRCTILGPNGAQDLIIPVTKQSREGSTLDFEVDDTKPWRDLHWRSVQAAYGRSPYFEYYGDQVKTLVYDSFTTLFEFQRSSLSLCLEVFGWDIKINLTEKYFKLPGEGVFDGRSQVHPKKDVNVGSVLPYTQVFGKTFVPNLSALDLLFCAGPESLLFIPTS